MQAMIGWLLARDADGNAYANARRARCDVPDLEQQDLGLLPRVRRLAAVLRLRLPPVPAYDTTCHRDHIHVSLSWEGAMERTSFWTRPRRRRRLRPAAATRT